MNDRLRTRLAAGGTIAALGVLATVALAAGSGGETAQNASSPTVPPPEVRTQVEHRTVHVRRKAEPARTTSTQAAPAATTTRTTAPVPAPAPTAVSSSRGGGGGDDAAEHEAEHENEAGDDDGGHGRGRGRGGDDD